ncbi:MAG TPA: DUF4142 domain-containing protein [Verrucomicrobiae bacterium]|nr:DUF4142 domain-containing protein [Verrucomicrobiae bacterium]
MKISKAISFPLVAAMVFAGVSASGSTARAQNNNSGSSSPLALRPRGSATSGTAKFLKEAARHNDMEVALAEMGARKAQNQKLKQYCQQLQHEQQAINSELRPIAREHGLSLDQSLTPVDQTQLNRLEKETGATFDRRLASYLLADQNRNISTLKKASYETAANDAKEYAKQTLPKIQQELRRTADLAGQVGVSQATISSMTQKQPEAVGGAEEIR